MGFCIYCKKKDNKHASSHFFRFPKEEYSEWIRNMGWKNWTPSKYSTLCSDHFSLDCLDYGEYRVRLVKGAVPTIFGNSNDKKEISVTKTLHVETHAPPVPRPELQTLHSPHAGNRTQSSSHARVETRHSVIDKTVTSTTQAQRRRLVQHDHHYVDTPATLIKKLNLAHKSIVTLKSERKVLRQKVKRSKIIIHSLKSVIKDLREQKLASDTAMYCLDGCK